MGKLLNKYKNGRGLYENSARTASVAGERRRDGGKGGRTKDETRTTHKTTRDEKKWRSRGGKKERAIRALRMSSKGHRALTAEEVRKMIAPALTPTRAKYGGQGFARASTYVNIASEHFLDEFTELFDEHIDGFNGKSYVKMGKSQEDMLWKQKLREKGARGGEGTSAPQKVVDGGQKHKHRDERVLGTLKTVVDADLRAQAIAAYRKLKAAKSSGR